ncbi:MAG: protein kinase [Nitrospirales bacterium]
MHTLKKNQLFAGKFEVQGEISKGKTGTIYYGYDMGLRQEVAIKIYHSHINGRVIQGKAFIEKSKPLLLIDHPNLIKIFKVEDDDDTPVIFMEFFDAPSLQQIIHDKGSLSVQDMLMLARKIAEVLVHTHFQGIIHGTLHPGHVLVGPQGQIKVMDLGLSWILMDIVSNGVEELLRPLPYFPPEIAKGDLLNLSSDLYSLGFMMYEMLTGTVPYAGLPKTSIMGKLAFDQADPTFDFPDAVPEVICDLIRKMTRNKTQERLQDATHVLAIINQQISKLPTNTNSAFLSSAAPQIPVPIPTVPAEAKEESLAHPLQHQAPHSAELPPQKTSPIQRPQNLMDYGQENKSRVSRNLGITIALIVLLGVAGALGYWYRDILEPNIFVHQTQQETQQEISPQETSQPQTIPAERKRTITPVQHTPDPQKPPIDTDNPPQIESPTLIAPTPKTIVPSVRTSPHSPNIEVHHNQYTDPPILPTPTVEGETPVVPNMNSSTSNQTPLPLEKQPAVVKPTASGISPQTLELPPGPKSAPQDQSQNPLSQKKESAASVPLMEDISQEPPDKEIEELLKALDTPVTDLPPLTAP